MTAGARSGASWARQAPPCRSAVVGGREERERELCFLAFAFAHIKKTDTRCQTHERSTRHIVGERRSRAGAIVAGRRRRRSANRRRCSRSPEWRWGAVRVAPSGRAVPGTYFTQAPKLLAGKYPLSAGAPAPQSSARTPSLFSFSSLRFMCHPHTPAAMASHSIIRPPPRPRGSPALLPVASPLQ